MNLFCKFDANWQTGLDRQKVYTYEISGKIYYVAGRLEIQR